MANNKGKEPKKSEQPKEPEGSKTIFGAVLKKTAETAMKNPGATAAAGAFLLVGACIPAAIAGAAASEKGRKVIGSIIPEGAKETLNGVVQQGLEGAKKLKGEFEGALGSEQEAPEAEAPKAEEKPAKPKRKPGNGKDRGYNLD